jgi:SAM-dependent methyltransferase
MPSDPHIAQAFDAIAYDYDRRYTENPSMRLMRRRVWKALHSRVREGDRILELGCGTGEDAVFLAELGCEVVATDCSPRMLECAVQKCSIHGLEKRVHFELADMDSLDGLRNQHADRFHGVLSNFGGLNTVKDLASLNGFLYDLLEPGGWFMATVMGPFCLWDWMIELSHLRFTAARVRRSAAGSPVRLGDFEIPCYFPTIRGLQAAFSSLEPESFEALGLLLPPPRVTKGHTALNWLWRTLETLERPLARIGPLRGYGDHYLALLRRP